MGIVWKNDVGSQACKTRAFVPILHKDHEFFIGIIFLVRQHKLSQVHMGQPYHEPRVAVVNIQNMHIHMLSAYNINLC